MATTALEKILFIPDVHRPYHSKKAWALMLRAARKFQPKRIVILGDFGDFYCTSRHTKNPNRTRNLEVEVDSSNEGLDELDELGAKFKHYVQGNHEENLERYLGERAPELFNMVSTARLFRLKERGWTYTPYRQHLTIGKMNITHDTGSAGAVAHTRSMEAFQGNVVIGHTHRMAVSYAGNAKGETHVGAMFGWLGDPSAAEYMHNIQKRHWTHGFGLGWMEPNGVVHLQAVPIVRGVCLINGEIVR